MVLEMGQIMVYTSEEWTADNEASMVSVQSQVYTSEEWTADNEASMVSVQSQVYTINKSLKLLLQTSGPS